MKLMYYHDFTGNDHYPLPFVLVYHGTQSELMDIGMHCRIYCKDTYVAADMLPLEEKKWCQSFHFLKKTDAMLCKLRHDV